MREKLEQIKARYALVQQAASDPDIIKDQRRYREIMQECTSLAEIVDAYAAYQKVEAELEGTRQMLAESDDGEFRELARQEQRELEERLRKLSESLNLLLIPKDPLDEKNIIMEIRAGTGGEEAALFVADLYRMYSRFAETRAWKLEILSAHATGIGGFKEIIFSIAGRHVFSELRYESGVHRVQRVPVTEAGGRIHTSAVTVAVLPEAEETDVEISPEDLRIDVFRSSGPGGQSVNTTDSAVRITHLPTGMVVTCQDEKSQHKNKAKALRVLRARLYEREEQKRREARAEERRSQIGSGDRSQRIRTYNFPQNRVTDHRINLTLYRLEAVLQGNLDELVDNLRLNARNQHLDTNDDS
jgi:peptide chain release factor 1